MAPPVLENLSERKEFKIALSALREEGGGGAKTGKHVPALRRFRTRVVYMVHMLTAAATQWGKELLEAAAQKGGKRQGKKTRDYVLLKRRKLIHADRNKHVLRMDLTHWSEELPEVIARKGG